MIAEAGTLISASTVSSNQNVGSMSNVTFTIKLAHSVQAQGRIEISFPKWNPEAPVPSNII